MTCLAYRGSWSCDAAHKVQLGHPMGTAFAAWSTIPIDICCSFTSAVSSACIGICSLATQFFRHIKRVHDAGHHTGTPCCADDPLVGLEQAYVYGCTKYADKPEIVEPVQVQTCLLCAVQRLSCVSVLTLQGLHCAARWRIGCAPRFVAVRGTSAISSTQAK
jgi:hypothetical protein